MTALASDAAMFPPDAVIRRVDGENVLLLGGGRALLMQLAHPSVAAGVAEHSDFERDPFGRLMRTLEASYAMVFGTREQARRTAAAVRAVHERVVGSGYRANDPALLLWVHATLVDTALVVYERFVGRLTPDEAEAYYQESTEVAVLLGVPRVDQPSDLGAFRAYLRSMVATVEVTDDARRVAERVLRPAGPWPALPAFEVLRQVSIGLLPLPLRLQYGLGWDLPRKTALGVAAATSRRLLPLVPGAVRRARIPGLGVGGAGIGAAAG